MAKAYFPTIAQICTDTKQANTVLASKSRVEKFITYIWNFPSRFSAKFHRSQNQTAKNNNNFPKKFPAEQALFALFSSIF